MRANLLCGRGGVSHMIDEDTRHSLPIGQMGNYQDYLKKQPMPLRELESAPVRQHMFGNPFKTNKNLMMMTDEVGLGGVDEVQIVSPGAPQQVHRGVKRAADQVLSAPPKRRKGPLARDYQFPVQMTSPVHVMASPEIDLSPEPVQVNHRLPQVNGIKPAGKIPSYFNDFKEEFEESGLQLIEEVKIISTEDSIRILDKKREIARNSVVKTSKLDISKNDFRKTIADDILSNLNEIKDSSLNSWMPNGQLDSPIHREPDLIPLPQIDLTGLEKPTPPESQPVEPCDEKRLQYTNVPPEITPKPVLENQLSPEELRSIRLRNNNVRQLIYKEVKRPGRVHSILWRMLSELHGPPWIRKQFILEVRQEAVRYAIQRYFSIKIIRKILVYFAL